MREGMERNEWKTEGGKKTKKNPCFELAIDDKPLFSTTEMTLKEETVP